MSSIEKKKSQLCVSCQECCKYLVFIMDKKTLTIDHQILYEARDCEILYTNDQVHILLTSVCNHLRSSGCNIYDTRPKLCQVYDGRRDVFFKDRCRWNELEEGE